MLGACFCSCNSSKDQLFRESGDVNLIYENVITDFANTYKTPKKYLEKRDGKPFDVFRINTEEVKEDLLVLSISPENNGFIRLSITDTLGKVPNRNFPNRFEVRKNKLFVWKDSITPLRKDILEVMDQFGVLDSTDVKWELGLLPKNYEDSRLITIDDRLKGVHYFLCKKNPGKYKKVVTDIAVGYYNPPKIKCKAK